MKRILYTAFSFYFVTLASCSENRAEGPGTEASKPASLPLFPPATTPITTTPFVAGSNIVTSIAAPKLNPAHGQPGHRCEIAVGAPLPIEPSQNLKTAIPDLPVINPAVQTISAVQTKTKAPVAAGLNPEHGRPGHRCDVAVGAPFPKGPVQSVKTPTPDSPLITPPLQNTPVIQPQASTAVAAGLNPAHGQPGHRCDIEVGKPLNSAPKKK